MAPGQEKAGNQGKVREFFWTGNVREKKKIESQRNSKTKNRFHLI